MIYMARLMYWIARELLIILFTPRGYVMRMTKCMAMELRKLFGAWEGELTAVILGTGWGTTLKLDHEISIPFNRFWFLRGLEDLYGHERRICFGFIEGHPVLALRGRIHLNEEISTPGASLMWRIVIEALAELGAKTLVTTAAVGALGDRAAVGDVIIVDGFFAPPGLHLGLFTGEFCAPDAILEPKLRTMAVHSLTNREQPYKEGGYAFFLGPNFESLRNKKIFYDAGLTCVGMSGLPEIAYWSTRKGVRALSLGFVTNDESGHSHEENVAAAARAAPRLGAFLRGVLALAPRV